MCKHGLGLMLDFSPSLGTRWETLGALTATSKGTVVTASATAGTKGTGVLIGTSTFAYEYLVIDAHNGSAGADYLLDIFSGNPATTGFPLVSDLKVSGRLGAGFPGLSLALPLGSPSGTALYARVASSTGSATLSVCLLGGSQGPRGTPAFSRVVSLFTPATGRGAVWTSSATVGADSGYLQLSAGVAQRLGGLVALIGGSTAAIAASVALRFAAGAAGSERVVLGPVAVDIAGAFDAMPKTWGPLSCDLPPNTRFSVAGGATLASVAMDVALYGLVP